MNLAGIALLVSLGAGSAFPAKTWTTGTPESVGFDTAALDAFRELVGGTGCVVRDGVLAYSWGDIARSHDIASAVKPVISTLLWMAVQEGTIASPDAFISDVEPALIGKDAQITWRHLASQTSGYGLSERPGDAYAYNDYALALYYDTLMAKVFRADGTAVLRERLADPLGFEDSFTFDAFGDPDRAGRLAVSVRDLARFGVLMLHCGVWDDRVLLKPSSVRGMLSSVVPANLPRSNGVDAPMLPNQRTLGGEKNQTPTGPGFYSFNWWVNGSDAQGRRLWVDAPTDTFAALGHGGKHALWVIPSLDLVVTWNDGSIADHDASPGNAETLANRAIRLLRQSVREPNVRRTSVSLVGGRWHVNGAITYPGAPAEGLLMNVRAVNATFEDANRRDFDPDANTRDFLTAIPHYVAHGVRAFTLNLQGGFPGYEGARNSAFEPDGALRASTLERVRRVIDACDRQGVVVILGCFYQRQDEVLRDEEAVRAGVRNAARWIRDEGFTNVVLEIANEYDHDGFDHDLIRTPEGEVELMRLARENAPGLLVSTSGLGHGRLDDAVARESDFLLIHYNGVPVDAIPSRIQALRSYRKAIVCNEDAKLGANAAEAARRCVENGASWGFMHETKNQHYPFEFDGADDDPDVYGTLRELTSTGL
jgi:CubicO group peptidase (beta-lactamase class C family)